MLALLDFEGQLCNGCGGYLPDTTDDTKSWTTELPIRCLRCDAVQARQAEYSNPEETTRPGALAIWPVHVKN